MTQYEPTPPTSGDGKRRGRKPRGEYPLTGAERQARYRRRQAGNRAAAPLRPPRSIRTPAGRSNGMPLSPHSSRCSPSMPLGSTHCPRRCATAPPARHYRPSSISISTSWSASSRRAALGGIEHDVAIPDRGSPTGAHRHPPRIATPDSWRSLCSARVPPVDSVHDPLRRCRFHSQERPRGQFFASPGGQFRMSFDTAQHDSSVCGEASLGLSTAHPRNVRFEDARVRRSIAGGGRSRIRRPLPMTI